MGKGMIVRIWIVSTLLLFMISACSSSRKNQGKEETKDIKSKSFQIPEIPPIYTVNRNGLNIWLLITGINLILPIRL